MKTVFNKNCFDICEHHAVKKNLGTEAKQGKENS